MALLADDVALEVDADVHGFAALRGLAAPSPSASFLSADTSLKPFSSMCDFAWPSVKLLAPATGAPGLGGLLGELTAGVLASRFAGGRDVGCWANAGRAIATRATEIIIFCVISFWGDPSVPANPREH